MTWGVVAVTGATVVGGVMAKNSADKASKRANAASAAELAFAQQQYDDWNNIYGPIQENLASYYNKVSPEYYSSIGLEAFQQEQQVSMQRIRESLAQRGIDPDSGIAVSLENQAELSGAETRAKIRRDAPRQAMEDKSRFLQIGMGQNPASNLQQTLSNRANYAQQYATQSELAAGQAIQSSIQAVGKGIDAYFNQTGDK